MSLFRKRNTGFTLLELIIVIIVIGILASIALPRYIRIAEKGRAGEAKSILSSIRAAEMRYSAQHSAYETNIANLDIATSTPKYFTFTTTCATSTDLADGNACLAEATRNTFENPGLGTYLVNITMGGNLTTNCTVPDLL